MRQDGGRGWTAELAAIGAAIVAAFAPISPEVVERSFSDRFYTRIQHAITPLSNLIPFALLDVLLVPVAVGVVLTLGWAIRSSWRARRVAPFLRVVLHLAGLGAVIYLLFLVLWGFNYRRVPMTERLVLDRGAPATADVVGLGLTAVEAMNRLYGAAHSISTPDGEWRNAGLRAAFAEVQRALSDAPPAEPGRLKHSIIGPYLRWAGVDGMINPFGLEVIANPDLLPFERWFVAAHEWSHLAGYGDEADANFVGWLTCIHAFPAAQYSGWFYLYWQISGEVGSRERATLNTALAERPRRDVNAVIARLRRGQIPALQQASWKVYDTYLKANRVEAGVRSYGAVVSLILRARFESGWTPVRRPVAQITQP